MEALQDDALRCQLRREYSESAGICKEAANLQQLTQSETSCSAMVERYVSNYFQAVETLSVVQW